MTKSTLILLALALTACASQSRLDTRIDECSDRFANNPAAKIGCLSAAVEAEVQRDQAD